MSDSYLTMVLHHLLESDFLSFTDSFPHVNIRLFGDFVQ